MEQSEIEFKFLGVKDEDGDVADLSLPYIDFLFWKNDYEAIVEVEGE